MQVEHDLVVLSLIRATNAKAKRPAGPVRREGVVKVLRQHQPNRRQWFTLTRELESAVCRLDWDGAHERHKISIGIHFVRHCVDRIQRQDRVTTVNISRQGYDRF
jgi:hypothetical protein